MQHMKIIVLQKNIPEDYDSATNGLSNWYKYLLVSGSVHVPNWDRLLQWCAVSWSRLQTQND